MIAVEGAVTGLPLLSMQEVAVARGAMLMRARNEDRSPTEGEVAVLRLCDTVEAFRASLLRLVEAVETDQRVDAELVEAHGVLGLDGVSLTDTEVDDVRWLVRHIAQCETCQERARAHRV